MTKYFLCNTPLAEIEEIMMSPPNDQTRGNNPFYLPGYIYLNPSHQERMSQIIEKRQRKGSQRCNSFLAALYLLTASEDIFQRIVPYVNADQIDFSSVCIRGIPMDEYVMYQTAKDIYYGKNRMELADLFDHKIVSDQIFLFLIGAFLISRFGYTEEKGQTMEYKMIRI